MPVTMTQTNGQVLVVYFTEGKILDDSVVSAVGIELAQAADKAEHGRLLLNFGDIRFMSSSLLGKLVSLQKKCKTESIDLKLCNIRPEILEVFKITGLHRVFDLQNDEVSALAAYDKKKWSFLK